MSKHHVVVEITEELDKAMSLKVIDDAVKDAAERLRAHLLWYYGLATEEKKQA